MEKTTTPGVCDYHLANEQCIKGLSNKINDHKSEIRSLAATVANVEKELHKRMDDMERSYSTSLASTTKDVTNDIRMAAVELSDVVSKFKDEFGGKINGTSKHYEEELRRHRKELTTDLKEYKTETDKEIKRKVPIWMFIPLLLFILGGISGLYYWQYDNVKDRNAWQECLAKELRANMAQLNDSVSAISGVMAGIAKDSEHNREEIRKNDQSIRELKKEMRDDLHRLQSSYEREHYKGFGDK